MSNYRRSKFNGGFYFFTVVTHKRNKILVSNLARKMLKESFERARTKNYFETIAFCLLPEHLHCIWKLPDGDSDYSTRWALIKKGFTINYLKFGGTECSQSDSRLKHRHRGIWQKRFWEHQIRDEKDLQKHIDYIHYNPVKHGLARDVADWKWSTYHKYVESGHYGKSDLKQMQKNINDCIINE